MGVPPGNRPAVPRDWFPYLNGTSQGEPVLSLSKEHPRTPGRTAISVVAASDSWNIRVWAPDLWQIDAHLEHTLEVESELEALLERLGFIISNVAP